MSDETSGTGVVVTTIDMSTPVGLDAAQTASAVRAGLAGFTVYDAYSPLAREFDDEPGELLVATHGLADADGWPRLLDLMQETLASVTVRSGLTRAQIAQGGLYFALPFGDEPIKAFNLHEAFLPEVRSRLALREIAEMLGTQSGSSGVGALLGRAVDRIEAGELELCVVVAVDSYLLDERLELYDRAWRLKTDRNPAGFIPGEAAAVLVVESSRHAAARGAAPRLRIDAVGRQQELQPAGGAEPSTGAGLCAAIREACAAARVERPIEWVLSDLDGERYKASEWGIVAPRLNGLLHPEHVHWQIAESIGNVGAAFAGIQIGCVAEAFARGYAPADTALLVAGNDGGQRTAIVVGRPVKVA